jgi:hypothetical protein
MDRLVDATYGNNSRKHRFQTVAALSWPEALGLQPPPIKSALHGLWPLYQTSRRTGGIMSKTGVG